MKYLQEGIDITDIDPGQEDMLILLFDIEITIGLLFCSSVKDFFRYMWE
jgi:hypothetical protein